MPIRRISPKRINKIVNLSVTGCNFEGHWLYLDASILTCSSLCRWILNKGSLDIRCFLRFRVRHPLHNAFGCDLKPMEQIKHHVQQAEAAVRAHIMIGMLSQEASRQSMQRTTVYRMPFPYSQPYILVHWSLPEFSWRTLVSSYSSAFRVKPRTQPQSAIPWPGHVLLPSCAST